MRHHLKSLIMINELVTYNKETGPNARLSKGSRDEESGKQCKQSD